ncbi:AraC family transcriptional regulator [Promicromonospora citrea]|uniref:AraC family transcriptional regulator n=1 Tax=Promicromonospora citrea TaxID=43677 RepID=UPI001488DD40|nr:AraC family transcriptional regulator [Promicromonospora citrea]NNH53610.1 AraC family transcriptional regulator [Promicromonospora citrea]
MDPLEDVLTLLEARGHLSARLAAGGDWALRFDAPDGIKFNAVRRGSCVLEVEGGGQPIELAAGDCYLLTRPVPFVLRSGPGVVPADAGPVFARADAGIARVGDGDDLLMLGGGFTFAERARRLLLDGLPPVVHVPAGTRGAETVGWALAEIEAELTDRPMASGVVAGHLATVMLVHVLRVHLAHDPTAASGWLRGLTDPVVAVALAQMHTAPAHPWTVAELAERASVSRSTLAARFRTAVGTGPLDYLTRWRIELAARRLREGSAPLASVARAVGYGSESALSVAFTRVVGVSPSAYRRGAGPR